MGGYEVATQAELDSASSNPRLQGMQALDALAHNREMIARNLLGCARAGLEPEMFVVFFTKSFELFTYRGLLGDFVPPARVDDLSAISRLYHEMRGLYWLVQPGDTLVAVELPQVE